MPNATVCADVKSEFAELASRVATAAAFMSRLDAALKGRHTLQEVQELLAQVIHPC
jgi:hypothetical protein